MPVDPHPDVTAAPCVVENFHVLPLSSPDDRRQQLDLRPLRQSHQRVHDLIHRLLLNDLAAFRAVRNPHPGVEQTEIVIDLRHRSHGGTRVPVGGFLVNGNGRGQSLNVVHVRLLHLSQELSRIRRQGLHVSALSLCINGIKSKRGLSGTTQSRQHHKFISRYIYINILQVVLPGTPNTNIFFLFTHVYLPLSVRLLTTV